MATGNFHSVNAENIYVINCEEEFGWKYVQKDIGQNIQEISPDFYKNYSIKSEEELRSFPSSSIGFFEEELDFLGLDFYISANVFLRSGYYQDANLDYEFYCTVNGEPFDDIYSIIEDIRNYSEEYDISEVSFAKHKDGLQEQLEKVKTDLTKKVESSLEKASDPYRVSTRFSNGEIFYERCA